MAQNFKYYFDLLSQPSRAMYIILKLSKTPFQPVPVALRKGEHLTEEYRTGVSRFQKVPCIVENDFNLSESIAILRYLDASGRISKNLYPSELKLRARIDEYLEWQHHNTRAACALYFQYLWVQPLLTGKTPNPDKTKKLLDTMETSLDKIEDVWLNSQNFIASNSLTVADIFAACEIEQPYLCGYDPTKNRPKLKAWLESVKKNANPYYDEAHTILYKLAAKSSAQAKL